MLWLFSHLIFHDSYCQSRRTGIPFITYHGIEQYGAGSHNLDIAQDLHGVIYIANHYGLLSFDGTYWKLVAQPQNKTMVRSIATDQSGRIYLGCQNEFGYIHKSPSGQLSYVSLVNTVPENMRDFNDIWKVVLSDESVLYHSSEALFIYSNGQVKTIEPKKNFLFVEKVFQKIYVVDATQGLMQLINEEALERLPDGNQIIGTTIAFILPYKNGKLLIGTENNGVYIYDGKRMKVWDNPLQNFFKDNKISNGIPLSNGLYAIGTIKNGVVIMDAEGSPYLYLNRSNGLYSNKINALFEDRLGNLWLAVDNGIDYVEISSPFSFFGQQQNLAGDVLHTLLKNGKLYVATTQGLFYMHWNSPENDNPIANSFTQIDELISSTYTIHDFDNTLFIGNQNGAYVLDNAGLKKISGEMGGWTFMRWEHNPDYIIGGTFTGLVLYKKEGGRWAFKHRIKGFNNSSRVMIQDDSLNIWVAHGYKGVYKLRLNEKMDSISSIQFYNSEKGFPSDIFISVFKVGNEILFGTERGVYYYDYETDKMKLHGTFAGLIDPVRHTRLLKEDNRGNIWYIDGYESEDVTGYLQPLINGNFRKHTTPFHKLKGLHVAGFENINFYNDDVFIGVKKGLIHYNPLVNKKYDEPFQVVLSEVTCGKNDSLIYGTVFPHFISQEETSFLSVNQQNVFNLPYEMNALRFTFSAPFFENQDQVKYSFYLEGYDNEWATWSARTVKEYTNLKEGNYIFRVKAVSGYGNESEVKEFRFNIAAPWYRSTAGYIVYVVFAIILIAGFSKVQAKRFEIEKKRLRVEQAKKLRLSQAEKVKLMLENENRLIMARKEKLESELALNTLNLAHLNEKLIEIREKLLSFRNGKATDMHALDMIISEINHTINDEEQWEQFKYYFNQTHRDFLNRLAEQYPDLTSVDIKVAALLRMNLSSKKIASLLNITVRGLEAARLRIRKKIGLKPHESLTEFMIKF